MPDTDAPKPIVLNVGITGHRAGFLTAPVVRRLQPVVDAVFRHLRDATVKMQESEDSFCSDTAASLRLHTALASGADQIAAKCARSSGYFVSALLPFEPDDYREDFALGEELDGFAEALAAADEIVALPGQRSDLQAAYVHVGESLVGNADVLVAIWDGEQGRGPGGTAHVVEMALQNSVPVIHIEVNRDTDSIRVRALVDGEMPEATHKSLGDPDLYTRVLRGAFKLGPAPAPAVAEEPSPAAQA